MKSLLLIFAALGASSANASPWGANSQVSQGARQAHDAYQTCLTGEMRKLQKTSLSIQQASEVAVGRCLARRDQFTMELLRSVTGNGSVASNQNLQAALQILDASEREMLRTARKQLAAARGVKWEEELHAQYQ